MSQIEVLEELRQMPLEERLSIVEEVVRTIRAALPQSVTTTVVNREEMRRRMAVAAQALRADYEHDSELTAFTALDGEDILTDEAR